MTSFLLIVNLIQIFDIYLQLLVDSIQLQCSLGVSHLKNIKIFSVNKYDWYLFIPRDVTNKIFQIVRSIFSVFMLRLFSYWAKHSPVMITVKVKKLLVILEQYNLPNCSVVSGLGTGSWWVFKVTETNLGSIFVLTGAKMTVPALDLFRQQIVRQENAEVVMATTAWTNPTNSIILWIASMTRSAKKIYETILLSYLLKPEIRRKTISKILHFTLPMTITDKITYQGHFHCRHFAIWCCLWLNQCQFQKLRSMAMKKVLTICSKPAWK